MTDFYSATGGTLPKDAPSYIPRQADTDLYQTLKQSEYCYVLTSRQMGKSSLMIQVASRLREDGIAVVAFEMTAIGINLSVDQWYEGLVLKIGEQLGLADELDDFWYDNEQLGPLQRLMQALRKIVLPKIQQPVVIFFDEIDVVRSLPFSTDEFFAAIRECYNARTQEPNLQRLTFCLIGVATPSDLIADPRITPFNIGQRIDLTDFTEAEAAQLARGLQRNDKQATALLKRILYWTNGQPYLTQKLCQRVADDNTLTKPAGVDRLCEEIFFSSRSRDAENNLQHVRTQVLDKDKDTAALLDLYRQVRSRKKIRDDDTNGLINTLRLSGLVRVWENFLWVRNRIYSRVFDREWIDANMPDAEKRRQKSAFIRGLMQAGAVATVIIFLMGYLAFWAMQAEKEAVKQRQLLEVKKTELAQANAELTQVQKQVEQKAKHLANILNFIYFGEQAYYDADYPTALEKWQAGIEEAHLLGNKRYIGQFLTKLGMVYENLGQYQTALDYYQRALLLTKEISDFRGEATNIARIGALYETLGQYQKALDYSQKALVISRKIGDKHNENNILANIGILYRNLGQYQQALDYYQKALTIYNTLDDRRGTKNSLNNIAVVYPMDQNIKSLEYSQQALKISREIADRRSEGEILANIGLVYNNLGDYPKSLDFSQQALTISREIGDKRGESDSLNNIGIVYKNLGEYQKAKNVFQDSIVIKKSIGAGDIWITQRGLAFTESKLNQPETAIKHYKQALDNIERIRNFLTKEHKTSFIRDKLYIYDELITLLQSQHSIHPKKDYDRKALETFERKQGRLFLEEMGQSGARRFSGLDNAVVEAEQSLTLKWKKLKAQPFMPQERAALEQAEEQLKAHIKAEYPKYYALKYPQPVDLATLQNQVLQKGEMMLVYGVLSGNEAENIDSKTILWVIGKQDFQMFILSVDEKNLEEKVVQLWGYLSDPSFHPEFPQVSLHLYQTLLPEAARQLLAGVDILYIVPTGPLYGLPFGSLVTIYDKARRKIQYLIEDYAISYLSSASLLKTLRDEERKIQPQEPLLAFADPEYTPCRSGNGRGNGPCFQRLAATADEVREIANLFNADHSKALYLGSKANRSTVLALNKKQELDDYRYIIFSVHGSILTVKNENEIEQPVLALSNPLTEGYLTMADVFSLRLNADLVMLSACSTGLGKRIKDEGINGLTRAFMYAGTSRVIVTLWNVSMDSAKDLSIGLFTNLKAKKKTAQALREIKLKMIQGRASNLKYMNPYHWASFIMFGDGR